MPSDAEKSYSETFIIWNDDVNLIGTLKPSRGGTAEICGSVKFKNGKQLSFFSEPDDCKSLRERLILLCRCIAEFYGTDVIRKKYLVTNSLNKTSAYLKEEQFSLN
jgi:hypothetical protein